jgi:biopolymer transport protein ExbD
MIKGMRRIPFHGTISLVALGDIAFLLITFFILSTNFVRGARIELDPAKAADIEKLKETPLTVQVDKQGKIWVRGKESSPEGLEPLLSSIAPTLSNKIVTVTIDRSQRQETFGPVILAISRAGLELALAGEEERRRGR